MPGTIRNAYTPCSLGIDGREPSLKGNADHERVCPNDRDDHKLGTMTMWCEWRSIASTATRSVYCDTIYRCVPLIPENVGRCSVFLKRVLNLENGGMRRIR